MRYCFYSGYKDLKGGYTTLLIAMIKELCHQQQNVLLINYKDGLIAKELQDCLQKVTLIDVDENTAGQIAAEIQSTDFFIITKFFEFHRVLLQANPRIIYYDINDYITWVSMYKFNWKLAALGKRLIRKMLQKNALVFMDDTGIFNLEKEFGIDVPQPQFLPVPVHVSAGNQYSAHPHPKNGLYRFTYVGRSADWKMYPLKKILEDCRTLLQDIPIEFTVVTDSIAGLQKLIDVDALEIPGKLSLKLLENILPSELNAFLLQHADLHFAMGTAALDAANLGIPTILVDYKSGEFPKDYGYRWLHQTRDYSLGKNLDKMAPPPGVSLNTIVAVLQNENELKKQSVQSREYVLANHDIKKIIYKLREIETHSSLRIKEVKSLVPFLFDTHWMIKKTVFCQKQIGLI